MARSAGHSTLPCAYLFEPAEPKPEVDLPSGAHEMGRRGESFAQADSIVGSAVFSLHSRPPFLPRVAQNIQQRTSFSSSYHFVHPVTRRTHTARLVPLE